jgi:predicted amidohydrolase YtcJ
MRVYGELRREKKLTVRVSMGIDTAATDADRLEEILQPWGVGPGFGDEWLRLDCVAEFAIDSGVETAYLRAPHLSERDNYLGEARLTPEKFREAVGVMHRYGWRPSIHLVGDRALDMALDAYEAADRVSSIRSRRWIVEHVPAIKPDQMERMARLGILVSAQIQPYLDGPAMIRDWGKERAERAVPVRAMLDHGLIVSSGTDWPGRSLSPFLSMYFYVTRKTADGTPLGVAERISRQEALKLATINNAYMTFEETTKGSIEPGKLADFLILSDDLLTVPEDQIRTVRTVATYVGGRKVFSTAEGNGY